MKRSLVGIAMIPLTVLIMTACGGSVSDEYVVQDKPYSLEPVEGEEDVLRVILGQGMRLTIVGVVVGLGAALGLTRLMSSLLFGIGSTDPWTFTSVAVLLLCVAASACYLPARRAMNVDPMIALRQE